MRLTYDPEADAAYVYVVPDIGDGEVAQSVELNGGALGVLMNADLSEDGKLLGIEIIGASDILPASALATAEII